MTLNDIIKLVDAGFTADQIGAMMKAAPAEVPEPAKDPEPAAAPEPVKGPEVEKDPEPDIDMFKALSDKIDAKFAEMAEAMKMPAVPSIGDIKPLGLDDIIRNFFKEE